MRTHVIVAVGAALFVIVSKYGFLDVVTPTGAQVDVTRVASNIVTGVSFLGAGVISMRGDTVQGLTTAAGVWVTAAVGLAIGSGMYLLGIFGAVLIFIIQILLHLSLMQGMEHMRASNIVVSMEEDEMAFADFLELMREKGIVINGSHIKRHKDTTLTYTLDVQIPRSLKTTDILMLVRECEYVKSIGM